MFWFLTWSDTNQAVQSQKMARGLKFRKVEGLYYLCSENKGADQLRGHHEADLRLCFRIAKHWFSHDTAHLCTQQRLRSDAAFVQFDQRSFPVCRKLCKNQA